MPASATVSSPRIAECISVTVSIVATASYSGVESTTRRRPTNPPPWPPAAPSRKSGPVAASEAASRACPPTPCARTPDSRNPSPGGVFPARVEREPLRRLPIRELLEPLQHHHHRHDHRQHRAPPHIGEQIGEHLIREQVEALPVQHTVNRVPRHPALTEGHRRPQQIHLNSLRPNVTHPFNWSRDDRRGTATRKTPAA
jgi:hypothetical protein